MGDFTIRVYALIIHQNQILLSRESIAETWIVKFPGGGLEFGESTIECLKREIKEETGLEAEIGAHFYTTDFFQPSQFHRKPTQVLSIYYRAQLIGDEIFTDTFHPDQEGFYWKKLRDLTIADVDLPIDKKVVEKLFEGL